MLLRVMIISFILMILMIDSAVLLKGKLRCWSLYGFSGGAVVLRLVCLIPDQVVWIRALARDIVMCPWARHFTLTVPLFTQEN